MGKTRKVIDLQTGHLTREQQQKKRREEKMITVGKSRLKVPPNWLKDEIAVEEFKRIVKELSKIDVIGNLDLENLGAYANAYSDYVNVTEKMKEEPYTVEKMTRYGPVIVPNPLIGIQQAYASEMRRFASLCGMTIDSRLKAASNNDNTEKNNIDKKFGGI